MSVAFLATYLVSSNTLTMDEYVLHVNLNTQRFRERHNPINHVV